MSGIEDRLRAIEDRTAIEDVLLAYYAAVDSLGDLEGLVSCFMPNAVFDLTALGLTRFDGHDRIRGFFAGVFAEMIHHGHHVTTFRVTGLSADTATATGYVVGMAESRDGRKVTVHCRYELGYTRTLAGWKIARFVEYPLMPFGDDVTDLHARG